MTSSSRTGGSDKGERAERPLWGRGQGAISLNQEEKKGVEGKGCSEKGGRDTIRGNQRGGGSSWGARSRLGKTKKSSLTRRERRLSGTVKLGGKEKGREVVAPANNIKGKRGTQTKFRSTRARTV